jgi:hypothetical protein
LQPTVRRKNDEKNKTGTPVNNQIFTGCLFLLAAIFFFAPFLSAGQEKANYELAARWTPAKVGKLVFKPFS